MIRFSTAKPWARVRASIRASVRGRSLQNLRGGHDNDPRFGTRMRGTGPFAELLRNRFRIACLRLGLNASTREPLSTALFRAPSLPGSQLGLGF